MKNHHQCLTPSQLEDHWTGKGGDKSESRVDSAVAECGRCKRNFDLSFADWKRALNSRPSREARLDAYRAARAERLGKSNSGGR